MSASPILIGGVLLQAQNGPMALVVPTHVFRFQLFAWCDDDDRKHDDLWEQRYQKFVSFLTTEFLIDFWLL